MFISRLSLWSRWRIVPWTGSLHWCAQASLLSSADCISARFTWLSIPSPGVNVYMWVTVKVTQSCLTLCNPMDYIGGSLVAKLRPTLVTAWTAAWQAPLSMGFSRQEYWNGLPFPSPGNLPNPGIEPRYPAWQEESLPTELWGKSKNTGVGNLSLLQQCLYTNCQMIQWPRKRKSGEVAKG